MDGINPKVLYEAWLERKKEEEPSFVDENPLQTQSDFIDMCQKAQEEKYEIEEPKYVELENHMVIGEYYNDEGEIR